ncbi:MAG: hypothetical protein LC130_33970 [Bryobacterales bacterium]|nr:hypothetical protein [Bryobacterales bacterium]
MRILLAVLVLILPLAAQPPQPSTFEGQPALAISSGKLDVLILATGATIASVAVRDDPEHLNPLWNPIRIARELGRTAGGGAGLGHFLCVDGFGPVSAEERAAGLPGHGEAHRQGFEILVSEKSSGVTTLRMSTRLPILHEAVTRTYRIVDDENILYVDTEIESLLGFDRPAVWAEHATIGSPFLEPGKTVVDISGSRSQTRPYDPSQGGRGLGKRLASGVDFTWPMAPLASGGTVNLRAAPAETNSGDHTTTLMTGREHAWVVALHPGKQLLTGWLFNPEEFPWLQTWENYPPTGKMARGLEFSTQPYDVPRREAIQQGSMFGAPVYRWLPAKSKITSRFILFHTQMPRDFEKVDDVAVEDGRIVIKSGTKALTLARSLPLW